MRKKRKLTERREAVLLSQEFMMVVGPVTHGSLRMAYRISKFQP